MTAMTKPAKEALLRDLETLPKEEFLENHPNARLNKETQQIIEILGELLGEELGKFDKRIDAIVPRTDALIDRIVELEATQDSMQKLRLSIREWQQDREEEMRDLRHTITALKSEIDLIREVLPPSNIKTKDVLQLVREMGEAQ